MLRRFSKQKRILWRALITFPSIFIAYLGIVFIFSPKISVTAPETVNPKEPYSSFFKVENLGSFPVYDIFYTVNIKDYYLQKDRNGYLELYGKKGEWLSYGPCDRITAKPRLDPLKMDTPSMEFTTSSFDELCHDGQEMILTMDYRPSFFPFKRTESFRFQLNQIGLNEAKWVMIADQNDFNPNLKTDTRSKAWVILRNNDRIFKTKDRAVKGDQIVLIGNP